jgi:hypothetical protein
LRANQIRWRAQVPSGRDLALQSQPQSLSARFGKDGRVLVQDILPEVRNRLADLKLPERCS